MIEALRLLGQGATYMLIGGAVGFFADTPSYRPFSPDLALIRLSFSHGGQRPDCRRRTPQELAALPRNMRSPMACPRERLPVAVALDLDGEPLYRAELPPTGIAGDGPARVHASFAVTPGTHTLEARLRDGPAEQGFGHKQKWSITVEPRRSFVIDFRADAGGFLLR